MTYSTSLAETKAITEELEDIDGIYQLVLASGDRRQWGRHVLLFKGLVEAATKAHALVEARALALDSIQVKFSHYADRLHQKAIEPAHEPVCGGSDEDNPPGV